jgi:hypothetical protein
MAGRETLAAAEHWVLPTDGGYFIGPLALHAGCWLSSEPSNAKVVDGGSRQEDCVSHGESRGHDMDKDLTFRTADTYAIPSDEEFAYGIESIEVKKHVWQPGRDVLRGALLHNPNTDKKFFVTEADLVRYRVPDPAPDVD